MIVHGSTSTAWIVSRRVTEALGGAAVDVFAGEPRVSEAPSRVDDVVFCRHKESAAHLPHRGMEALVVAGPGAHLQGTPLASPVAQPPSSMQGNSPKVRRSMT